MASKHYDRGYKKIKLKSPIGTVTIKQKVNKYRKIKQTASVV
jgi:hypothetical protein